MTKRRGIIRRKVAKAAPAAGQGDGWPLDGLTGEQQEEAQGIKERVKARPRRASLKSVTKDGKRALIVGDGSAALETLHSMRVFDAVGSRSTEFVGNLLRRLCLSARLNDDDKQNSDTLSAALALIASVEPRNELEATMALQMVAANEAALMCFERSRKAEWIEHASAYSNMGNKAMRSFALHAEALAKLRRGGEQVVKHLHVYEGGQAVVAGTINQKRGGWWWRK